MITVVIPVYNRAKELKECLDSIEAQTYMPAKVIVVDDGSTDDTVEVAKAHAINPVVVECSHIGAAAARNRGLELVETPWTMFFDSDDIMLPDHIKKACEAIDDQTDMIGWNMKAISAGGVRICPFETVDIEWHNIMHGCLSTQRYMARTEMFRKAVGWNENIRIWMDIELGARLLKLKPRIKKVAGISLIQNVIDNSITGPSFAHNADKFPAVLAALAETTDVKRLDLKKAILAADVARDNKKEGRKIFKSIENPGILLKIVYLYQKMGGRGAARLVRPFFK